MRVYRMMKREGLLYFKARKHVRRRWVRLEREHSNSLWHADWHEMKDRRWKGQSFPKTSIRWLAGATSDLPKPVLTALESKQAGAEDGSHR